MGGRLSACLPRFLAWLFCVFMAQKKAKAPSRKRRHPVTTPDASPKTVLHVAPSIARERLPREIAPRVGTQDPLVTRSEAARILGASIATVRRLENEELATVTDALGVHRFRRSHVEALAAQRTSNPRTTSRDPGERAARAWELFSRGSDLREVVIALRIHPTEARELLSSFQANDFVVLPPPVAAELGSLGFGDPRDGRVSAASVLASARRLREAARPRARAAQA